MYVPSDRNDEFKTQVKSPFQYTIVQTSYTYRHSCFGHISNNFYLLKHSSTTLHKTLNISWPTVFYLYDLCSEHLVCNQISKCTQSYIIHSNLFKWAYKTLTRSHIRLTVLYQNMSLFCRVDVYWVSDQSDYK